MIKCPHSVYFFRGSDTDFRYFSFDDFGGEKRGSELTASPNPLLTLEYNGKFFRTSDEFIPYDEETGKNVNFVFYEPCEYPLTSFKSGVTYYIKSSQTSDYWYEEVPAGTPIDQKIQYYVVPRRKIKKWTYVQVMRTKRATISDPAVYQFVIFKGDMAHTLLDWGLVPLGMPVMAPPQQKLHIVDIPCSDGVLDLSNSLTRYPVFDNRRGTMNFAILHEETSTNQAYTKMLNFLQGTNVKMILEDDPDYFYEGRVYVDSIDAKSDGHHSEVSIGYDLFPYRKSIYSSLDNWTWDDFNFELDSVDQSICMNKLINIPFATTGGLPDPSKEWDDAHTVTIDLTGIVGQEPVHPYIVVAGQDDSTLYAQLWNSDIYGNKWVGSGVNYYDKYKNSDKIKWSNGTNVDVFELLDTEQNVDMSAVNYKTSDVIDAYAKRGCKFRKLILCEFTPESVVKMRFKGLGRVSIYFRKGML